MWNRLNNHIVSAQTLGSFKRSLDKFVDKEIGRGIHKGTPTHRSKVLFQLPSFSYVLMFLF